MDVRIYGSKRGMGRAAAEHAADLIRTTITRKDAAVLVLATGASQFDTLQVLTTLPDIDWSAVTLFHLDEYIGIGPDHPASFRRYLRERFVSRVPQLAAVHWVDPGLGRTPLESCRILSDRIRGFSVDVMLAGIGENGHLAFNDPPADFHTEDSFIVVDLDERCRRQQLGEGWFERFEDVPEQAISMSIQQILKANHVILSVPDRRKAEAVRDCVQGPVSPDHPASVLQQHPSCTLYLDRAAASLLN